MSAEVIGEHLFIGKLVGAAGSLDPTVQTCS